MKRILIGLGLVLAVVVVAYAGVTNLDSLTLSDDLIVSGNTTLTGTTTQTGGITVAGALTANGDATLGNATTDTVTLGGNVSATGSIRPTSVVAADSTANTGVLFCLRQIVSYTDTSSTVLGTIPAGADIVDYSAVVLTTFDDGSADYLHVTTTAGPGTIFNEIDISSAGITRAGASASCPTAILTDVGATAKTVYANFRGEDGDATQGSVAVTIIYQVDGIYGN